MILNFNLYNIKSKPKKFPGFSPGDFFLGKFSGFFFWENFLDFFSGKIYSLILLEKRARFIRIIITAIVLKYWPRNIIIRGQDNIIYYKIY